MRAAFSRRCSFSIMSMEAGCHAVVRVRENPVMLARVLKLPALVGCYLLGAAETSNQYRDEGLSDCFGGNARQRECLRPCVSVDGSETVPKAGGDRQRPDQVDMHMRETSRRKVETPERGLHMPRYLGQLAVYTRMSMRGSLFPTPGHTNRWNTNFTVALAPGCLRP